MGTDGGEGEVSLFKRVRDGVCGDESLGFCPDVEFYLT